MLFARTLEIEMILSRQEEREREKSRYYFCVEENSHEILKRSGYRTQRYHTLSMFLSTPLIKLEQQLSEKVYQYL